jgi:predicted helicase
MYAYDSANVTAADYRPFTKQRAYFDRQMNSYVNQLPRIFPTPGHENFGFYMTGLGASSFSRF